MAAVKGLEQKQVLQLTFLCRELFSKGQKEDKLNCFKYVVIS